MTEIEINSKGNEETAEVQMSKHQDVLREQTNYIGGEDCIISGLIEPFSI